ncbi:hypothetical protein [Micromonospora zamorensis]|uniref:hypothetical protein n=1 Tax=Micromonospora zamorensis TaxID=709883 RepID=UPI0033C4AA7C
MELTVEVQAPDSPGTRHAADSSRVAELAAAIAAVSRELPAQLDQETNPPQCWDLDGLEVTFCLDLQAGSGVVLVRDDDRHAVAVKCTYKRASRSS